MPAAHPYELRITRQRYHRLREQVENAIGWIERELENPDGLSAVHLGEQITEVLRVALKEARELT